MRSEIGLDPNDDLDDSKRDNEYYDDSLICVKFKRFAKRKYAIIFIGQMTMMSLFTKAIETFRIVIYVWLEMVAYFRYPAES